jgi:hypothetical protein
MFFDGLDLGCHDLASVHAAGASCPCDPVRSEKRIYPRAAIGWHTFRIVINQVAALSRHGGSGALSA